MVARFGRKESPLEVWKCESGDGKEAKRSVDGLLLDFPHWKKKKTRLINVRVGIPEETALDLMLLLSKIVQRDIGSSWPRLQNKTGRRLRRNEQCNRLIGLFTACKHCFYIKKER